jgi:hypothetical protein
MRGGRTRESLSKRGAYGKTPMELKQQQKLTREEFDRIASEIRDLVGDKMRNHKEGDAERLLLKRQ